MSAFTDIFGPDHVNTLTIQSRVLLTAYIDSAQYQEAVIVYREFVMECEKSLGFSHELTTHTRGKLATIYHQLERYGEELKTLKMLLQCQETELKPDHPQIMLLKKKIAVNLLATHPQDREGVETLAEVDAWVATLSMDNFARMSQHYYKAMQDIHQLRYEAAWPVLVNLLQRQVCALGKHHICTLDTKRTLGEVLESRNNLIGASELYEHVGRELESIYKVWGSHPRLDFIKMAQGMVMGEMMIMSELEKIQSQMRLASYQTRGRSYVPSYRGEGTGLSDFIGGSFFDSD